MTKFRTLKPVTAALIASAVSVATVHAGENPFKSDSLNAGFNVAETDKGGEGKCGEGKCGEGKCGSTEGDDGKGAEGKCGAHPGK